MIRKAHEAARAGSPELMVWGTGAPRREFLHVDDLADAALFLMRTYDEPEIINVGTGTDISIRELVDLIVRVSEYKGQVTFDTTKPDGTPRKLLDVTRLAALGWKPAIGLEEGIAGTWRWYVNRQRQPAL